jgi:hypothetical protein
LLDALDYCIEHQVDVVNLSLGSDDRSELVEQKLAQAKAQGIALIVAAGNSSGPVKYPAASPNVLAVSAVGRFGEYPADSYHATQPLAGTLPGGVSGWYAPRFSCFGPEVGLAGPGVAILSSVPADGYAVWDGTSMATPHVTGLAALVLAHHPDFQGAFRARSAARVDRLFAILKASCQPLALGDPGRTGAGFPDALRALGMGMTTQPQPPATTGLFNPDVLAALQKLFAQKPAALQPASVQPAAATPGAVSPESAPITPASIFGDLFKDPLRDRISDPGGIVPQPHFDPIGKPVDPVIMERLKHLFDPPQPQAQPQAQPQPQARPQAAGTLAPAMSSIFDVVREHASPGISSFFPPKIGADTEGFGAPDPRTMFLPFSAAPSPAEVGHQLGRMLAGRMTGR